MSMPASVKIVEVGPRDGLQNETQQVPTDVKINFIKQLADAGLEHIEATSFVSPEWVPQMADSEQVMQGINDYQHAQYSALVPNIQGLEHAIDAGVKEVGIFTAVSESFCQKNINCSIAESLQRYEQVITRAGENNITVRAYISCVLGCPYEGEISLNAVADLAATLQQMGCYEVSLGDTIGVGTAGKVKQMIKCVAKQVPINRLAVHFHDTYGQALANIYAALEQGISVIDSACGGLGGCPYAKGASGNVATEDVVYMLNGLDIHSGVELSKLVKAAYTICGKLNKQPNSRVSLAIGAK